MLHQIISTSPSVYQYSSISISIEWEIFHLLHGAKEGAVLQEHIAFVHRFVTKPLIKGSLDLFYEEARWYQV